MSKSMKTRPEMTVEEWQEKEFLPWKAAMGNYLDARSQQVAKLKRHAPQLQGIIAMMIDGRSKQAMLAWNTLELQPKLRDLRLSSDGESMSLVAHDGTLTLLKLDDVIADLQSLLEA